MGRKKRVAKPIPVVHLTVPPDKLESEINKIDSSRFNAFSALCKILQDNNIQQIRCFGIGDPCINSAARAQASFIMKVGNCCKIKNITYYDPITCESCCEILSKIGFKVENENTNGVIEFASDTALFMPHCPRFLYHNMLVSNWVQDKLSKMFIIGNSFSNYEEKVRLFIQKKSTAIEELYAKNVVNEVMLDFGGDDFFDNTSVMTICSDKLPPQSDSFWSARSLLTENDL